MRQQPKPLLRRIAMTIIAAQGILFVVASAAWAARTAEYSFTMDHQYVNGRDNVIMHPLEGGVIDNSGSVWMTSRDGGSSPSPSPVVIEVWRDGGFFDLQLCETAVTPDPVANTRVPYAESCGKHPGDDFYIVAWKEPDDGWNVAGLGRLDSIEVPKPNDVPPIDDLPVDPWDCC